uniref:EF-hand domain-containing protein n=1 Tax=Latimeria chalumnae TaxID=7897 RepID=H3B271_LATCH
LSAGVVMGSQPDLQRLFSACDVKRSGRIELEEFAALCRELQLPAGQVQPLFARLDVDRDGTIDFSDFSARFQEVADCLQREPRSPGGPWQDVVVEGPSHPLEDAGEGEMFQWEDGEGSMNSAWRGSSAPDRFLTDFLLKCLQLKFFFFLSPTCSREQLSELYLQIHTMSDFTLLRQYEHLIEGLIQESRVHRLEMEKLESTLRRTEELFAVQAVEMEEDLQQQVLKVENRVQQEEHLKLEEAITNLRKKQEVEMMDLQATINQLKVREEEMLCSLSKDDVFKLKEEISELAQENTDLRNRLLKAQTNISLLQTEMDQIKNEFADHSFQYEREREELRKMVEERISFSDEIVMLQEANKSLYESNDGLRSALVTNFSSAKKQSLFYLHSEPAVFSPPPPEWTGPDGIPYLKASIPHSIDKVCQPASDPQRRTGCRSDPMCLVCYLGGEEEEEEEEESEMPNSYSGQSGKFSEVADWADKYLDNSMTTSGDAVASEGSDSEYDSDQSDGSNDTVHQGSSDVEVSRRNLSQLKQRKSVVEEEESSLSPTPLYRLVLAGDAGAGKSSFLLRLCMNEFRGDIPTTLGVDFQIKKLLVDGERTTLQIWDTAGQERFRSIAKSYFRKAHGVLLMYDVTSETSFLNVREWIDEIMNSTDKPVPVILIGNKIDLRDELPESSMVNTLHGEKLAMTYNSLFCETSAKDGTNVVEAVLHLAREVKKNADVDASVESVTKLSITDRTKAIASCCKT